MRNFTTMMVMVLGWLFFKSGTLQILVFPLQCTQVDVSIYFFAWFTLGFVVLHSHHHPRPYHHQISASQSAWSTLLSTLIIYKVLIVRFCGRLTSRHGHHAPTSQRGWLWSAHGSVGSNILSQKWTCLSSKWWAFIEWEYFLDTLCFVFDKIVIVVFQPW